MEFVVIDLFSGAGGVTTGIEQAEVDGVKVASVICAINHDRLAIESHWRNHPHVKHFVEDIRTFDVKRLPAVPSDQFTKKFLWASLECTNHSNAKGGLSRDADSRTLAEHLPPYIEEFDPDYIGIENVREFKDWGPLVQKRNSKGELMFDKKGKPYMIPDKEKKGIDFKKWLKSICDLGYHYEMKMLNAADFGANTSRRRLFIIFAKEGLPIVWPEPTHDKHGNNGLPKWKPVKECLDFTDKGQNIFGRKKNLCENTYQRIYAGLKKFIANGDDSFITKYLGNNEKTRSNNGKSVNEPSLTITTQLRLGLVQPEFILNYHHSSNANSIEKPASTLTTHDKLGLVQTEGFYLPHEGFYRKNQPKDFESSANTITQRGGGYVVQTEHFIAKYNSSHNNTQQNAGNNIDEPSPTVLARPGLGLVSVDHFIDMQHGSGKQHESIDEPAGAILPVVKKNLVTVERFIDQQFGASKPISENEPCNALTANPKYNLVSAFIYNPQYQSKGGSIDDPCFTLIGKMDKRPPSLVSAYLMDTNYGNVGRSIEDPCFSLVASRRYPYLVELERGEIAIKIEKNDTEIMRKIKMFMAAFGIIAIYMRMLRIPELKKITGFYEEYILEGTQADQKKYIGNAVPPVLPKSIFEALYRANNAYEIRIAV